MQQGPPPMIAGVQLVLNDKGRVEVDDKLGSAVDRVEGRLTAQNATSYTLEVSQVYQLGGNSTKWSGEVVTIAKDGTNGYRIHRYNQTRTIVVVVAIVAATVLFLVGAGLKGGGTDQPNGGSGNTGNQTH